MVAPITRAVDDRAAQTLLDASFKRQLQFDGTYSGVTVICSKTDDIPITEALKELPEGDKAREHHDHAMLLETERGKVQDEITELKTKVAENKLAQGVQFEELDSLREAIRRSDAGDELLLVSPGSARKRNARTAASDARKKIRLANTSDTDTDSDLNDDSDASETETEEKLEEQVSRETAQKRFEETMALNAVLRAEQKKLEHRLKPLYKTLREIKGEIKSLKSQAKRACIRFRNQYTRPAIQGQFAEGIRE